MARPTLLMPRMASVDRSLASLRPTRLLQRSFQRGLIQPRSTSIRPPPSAWAASKERAATVRRMKAYTAALLATGTAMVLTVSLYPTGASTVRYDTALAEAIATEPLNVETGTSTIPTFPRYIDLPSQNVGAPSAALPAGTASGSTDAEEEYQLLGLGVRTVSFLGIQVYVVGLYVAVPDIAALQERLIRTIDPVATTLVPGERDKLHDLLLDPDRSEEIWSSILKDGGIRTAVRIVPTRNTDYAHLRDGWVRGITSRTQAAAAQGSPEFDDEAFARSMADFKALFGGAVRGKLPKGETLLLLRNRRGELDVYHERPSVPPAVAVDPGSAPRPVRPTAVRTRLTPATAGPAVADERIARLIWLGYLAGRNVSSEAARKSMVEGAVGLVGRPVGTVATQVI